MPQVEAAEAGSAATWTRAFRGGLCHLLWWSWHTRRRSERSRWERRRATFVLLLRCARRRWGGRWVLTRRWRWRGVLWRPLVHRHHVQQEGLGRRRRWRRILRVRRPHRARELQGHCWRLRRGKRGRVPDAGQGGAVSFLAGFGGLKVPLCLRESRVSLMMIPRTRRHRVHVADVSDVLRVFFPGAISVCRSLNRP